MLVEQVGSPRVTTLCLLYLVKAGVLGAEPQDVAVVGHDALQAAPVLGLVHLAQEYVQRAQRSAFGFHLFP